VENRDDTDDTADVAASEASAPRPARRWRDDLQLIEHRDLRLVLLSRLVSDFGTGIAPIALAFGVLALPGGSASGLGLVLVAAALPRLVFLLLGGVIADRVRSRARLLAATEAVAAVAQLTAALLFLTGHASVPALAAVALVNGTSRSIFYPTMTGLVPHLAPGDALQSANALIRLSMSVAGILGTALGGLLVATAGAGWALLVDAVTYAVSAGLLAAVRAGTAPRVDDTGLERASVVDDLLHGWQEFTARRWVWLVVVLFSFANVGFTMTIGVLGPVRAQTSFSGATSWAVVMAAFMAGSLVGVVLAMRLRPTRPMLVGMLAELTIVLPVASLAVPMPVAVVAAMFFVNGLALNVFEILWSTSLQQHIPPASLSRVASYDWFGSMALTPVALAAAGPLAAGIGLGPALWVSCALCSVTAVALLDPQVRRLRAPA
jgi:predicted MFS family arabinose efflux permease